MVILTLNTFWAVLSFIFLRRNNRIKKTEDKNPIEKNKIKCVYWKKAVRVYRVVLHQCFYKHMRELDITPLTFSEYMVKISTKETTTIRFKRRTVDSLLYAFGIYSVYICVTSQTKKKIFFFVVDTGERDTLGWRYIFFIIIIITFCRSLFLFLVLSLSFSKRRQQQQQQ